MGRRPVTEKRTVGVFFGGRSGEHEISLLSARSILAALDREKYELVQIGITKDGRWLSGEQVLDAFEAGDLGSLRPVAMLPEPDEGALYWREPDRPLEVCARLQVAFPVLHGTYGEDGTLQGMLELADIPYVGGGVLASSAAMDKGLFKAVMRAWDIPVVDWVVFTAVDLEADFEAALKKAEALGPYPLFTKPANLGSSVGISRCRNRADLVEGLREAARYDRRVIVECGLDAREIEISVLGNERPQASVAGEIVPSDAFYSYKAKYQDDDSELIIPAHIEADLMARARELAVRAYEAIDGAGMARVDFLLDRKTGELYLNEINTIPGFTKISMYPKLWEASGLSYPALLDRLIELALERHRQKGGLVRSYEDAS
ncbi:MAG TPA: D-alanine--D-alanine ligase [Chloroflexi bacterium]|nr:D-alanine--D-alanine ligase [Chloroflexota bacterium]